jgi:hypothetical protein
MNRFMVGCSESELYASGSVLGSNLIVESGSTANVCEWDDSLLGKTIRAVCDGHNFDFTFNGDTGKMQKSIPEGHGNVTYIIVRFFKNGGSFAVTCYSYYHVFDFQHGYEDDIPIPASISQIIIL